MDAVEIITEPGYCFCNSQGEMIQYPNDVVFINGVADFIKAAYVNCFSDMEVYFGD